jgi:hypothetical protein
MTDFIRQQPGSRPAAEAEHADAQIPLYGVFLLTYCALWILFLLAMAVSGRPWPEEVSGIDLLLLSLATFRLTEIVTEEKVARCIRAPFCERVVVTKPDGTQDYEERPKGQGLRRVAGELILCPWCTGIWIATLLCFFWLLIPGLARVLMTVFAVAAGGLFFQILTKLMDRKRQSIPEE